MFRGMEARQLIAFKNVKYIYKNILSGRLGHHEFQISNAKFQKPESRMIFHASMKKTFGRRISRDTMTVKGGIRRGTSLCVLQPSIRPSIM